MPDQSPLRKPALARCLSLGVLLASLGAPACADEALDTDTTDESLLDAPGTGGLDALAPPPGAEPQPHAGEGEGESKGKLVSTAELPFVDPIESAETFLQLLPEPTALGQNVALHVRLPAPSNPELEGSLVRVLGDAERPLVVFRSDALAELGRVPESPGPEFFTALLTLDLAELERRKATEQALASFEGEVDETRLRFSGRTPVALTTGVSLNVSSILAGSLVSFGPCPVMPLSEQTRWDENLAITDFAVVRDETRTNDICDPAPDNPNGVWTFKHLMEEMATGSGLSTHDFVVHWLENWINPMTVNGDFIPERMNMVTDIVQPWAALDGLNVIVVNIAGRESLRFEDSFGNPAQLDLDKAPFRLSAIVNRIDLGGTTTGPAGYGGALTSQPTDAGELRFVFGIQDAGCGVMPFSVIFEYGVPISGCADTRDWAVEWTKLNDPGFAPRFSPAWLAHLEGLTESVVKHGRAPSKGNQNAINQIRTNENALDGQWEFREFTLSTEALTDDPATDIDTPASGPLQPHSVAQTPNDADFPGSVVFDANGDPTIDDFLFTRVLPGTTTTGTLPGPCSASYDLTGHYTDTSAVTWELRGGNSFTAAPTHWKASVSSSDADEACARHQFSLNTCNGCHFDDAGATFFHIDPTVDPAQLSDFMTGGAGVGSVLFSVPDSQFPGTVPDWTFNDLHRRFERLYAIACTACGGISVLSPSIVPAIIQIAGVAPIDSSAGSEPPGPVGPILELDQVAAIADAVTELSDPDQLDDVELGAMVRPAELRSH